MSAELSQVILHQWYCRDCNQGGELTSFENDAIGAAVLHDAENHSGVNHEGEDG